MDLVRHGAEPLIVDAGKTSYQVDILENVSALSALLRLGGNHFAEDLDREGARPSFIRKAPAARLRWPNLIRTALRALAVPRAAASLGRRPPR